MVAAFKSEYPAGLNRNPQVYPGRGVTLSMSLGQEIGRWAAGQRSTDSQPHGCLEPLFGIKAREAFRIDHDGGRAACFELAAVERERPAGVMPGGLFGLV